MAEAAAETAHNDYTTLSGPEKAAIFLFVIGQENAAKLFALMHDDEIRDVSQVMAALGSVPADVVERLSVDFAGKISTTGSVVGSFDSTERLLNQVLPDSRVRLIMDEIRGPAGRTMWDKLANVNETVLANYLKNEYPQTVAVVLSKVKAEHAAKVLAVLPESYAMDVVMRMLRMEAVQKDVLEDVERTLRTEFMTNLARTSRRDSHEMVAEIFNNLDRNSEQRFMAGLEERSRDSAERVKDLMFTFDDLVLLDSSAVQTLLRALPKERLTVAMKGASDKLKNLFYTNMSQRAGKLLKEEIESMGPVRLRDVEESQMLVVHTAKDLAAKGEIMLADARGDDPLVY